MGSILKIVPSIAVVQLGKYGDMILTTPLFRAVKQVFPEAKLCVIADEQSSLIAKVNSNVDEIISIPRGIMRIPTLMSSLRYKKFDIYIDHKNHFSRTSQMSARFAKFRNAYIHAANQPATKGNYINLPRTSNPENHYVDLALAPIKMIKPEFKFNRKPEIKISNEIQRSVDSRIDTEKSGLVVINISAGSQDRKWKEESWRELIVKLSKKYSVGVISTPQDSTLANRLCAVQKNCRIIRTENILEAAAVVKRATIVISSDTSVVHIASAFNKPCIALFTDDKLNMTKFKPMGDHSRAIATERGKAVVDISVKEVIDNFNAVETELKD